MSSSVVSIAHAATVRFKARRAVQNLTIRMVRPSLLDSRFSGDPWIVDRGSGPFAICLGNYPLAWIEGLAFDLPSLNHQFLNLRRYRARACRGDQRRRAQKSRALAV